MIENSFKKQEENNLSKLSEYEHQMKIQAFKEKVTKVINKRFS